MWGRASVLSRPVSATTVAAMEPELRVASPGDWEDFRAVRLRALEDSPTAFGATLAEAAAHPDDVWRDRLGGPGPTLLAYVDGGPAAMGGLFAPEDSAEAFVWGMWVAPEARGQGLGRAILGELVRHAEELDRSVLLHVTEGNDGARRLYESHGFAPTGEWEPLREGSDLRIELLRLDRG